MIKSKKKQIAELKTKTDRFNYLLNVENVAYIDPEEIEKVLEDVQWMMQTESYRDEFLDELLDLEDRLGDYIDDAYNL